MNCKQGDMALIIRSQAGNEGKVVTCLEYIKGPVLYTAQLNGKQVTLSLLPGDWWRIDRNVNMFVEDINGDTVVHPDFAPFAFDKWLKPIGNRDNPEEVKDDVKLRSPMQVE